MASIFSSENGDNDALLATPTLSILLTPLFQLIFLERLECTRHCAKCFTDIVSFSPHSNLRKKVLLFHHVADEEMKAQRGKMTCPQSRG